MFWGAIVQMSSSLGLRAAPLQLAYCGAKNAAQGFTDSLRSELIHDRSRVSLMVVYLPAVTTPQFRRARNHTAHAQNAPREIGVGRST
jgi:short-subunit dehydrogenase